MYDSVDKTLAFWTHFFLGLVILIIVAIPTIKLYIAMRERKKLAPGDRSRGESVRLVMPIILDASVLKTAIRAAAWQLTKEDANIRRISQNTGTPEVYELSQDFYRIQIFGKQFKLRLRTSSSGEKWLDLESGQMIKRKDPMALKIVQQLAVELTEKSHFGNGDSKPAPVRDEIVLEPVRSTTKSAYVLDDDDSSTDSKPKRPRIEL